MATDFLFLFIVLFCDGFIGLLFLGLCVGYVVVFRFMCFILFICFICYLFCFICLFFIFVFVFVVFSCFIRDPRIHIALVLPLGFV